MNALLNHTLTILCQEAVANDLDDVIEDLVDDEDLSKSTTFKTYVKHDGVSIVVTSYYGEEWRESWDEDWHDTREFLYASYSVVDIDIEENNNEEKHLVVIEPCDIEDYIYNDFNLWATT